jgi:hypothetical protein
VLDLHLHYLADDGVMIVQVPNKLYFRKIFGYLFDYPNLKAHNLKALHKQVFIDFAARNNMDIKMLEYVGGFPYGLHQKINLLQRIFYFPLRIFFKKINPYLAKRPSKYYSTSLYTVMTRKRLAVNSA